MARGIKGTGSSTERNKRWRERHPGAATRCSSAWRKLHPGYLGPKRQAMVDKVALIKESNPCVDCGGYFPACCMEFDHCKGVKHKEVGSLVASSAKWQDVEQEMEHCELVCSNCHRIRTQRAGSEKWHRKTIEKDEEPKGAKR